MNDTDKFGYIASSVSIFSLGMVWGVALQIFVGDIWTVISAMAIFSVVLLISTLWKYKESVKQNG